jgi:hypothetical protein
VPAFDLDAETRHPDDFRLLQSEHIALFRRDEVLRSAVESLQTLGYRVVEFDAATWRTTATMHEDLVACCNSL